MSYVCLDANIIFKLVIDEPDSPVAEALWSSCLDHGMTAVAPLILPFEVFSAIRRRVFRGLLNPVRAAPACYLASVMPISYVHHNMLMLRALQLAAEYDQPTIYDTMYLAVAETCNCVFWTADERFYHAVSPQLPFVRLLADYGRTPAQ